MLEKLESIRKDGTEKFSNGISLIEYWAWAHSDVMGNAERGKLAEYIVAMALDVHNTTRTEWDSYDIETKDGIKIEVKSSGYIQTWYQGKYSDIKFGIQPTQAWNKETNTYDQVKKRQADLYVFCVHHHKDQETIDPLDLSQWTFYVLSTMTLNQSNQSQKTIDLGSLKKLGALEVKFGELRQTIKDVVSKNSLGGYTNE